MKFMKLGIRPDTFYSEEAIRTVLSDVPSDLTIRINGISYLLHKLQYALLPKCGLLQRLVSSKDNSINIALDLHDIPGGDEAFEVCAKFCYGITIELSAHSFVSAFCAAKFLRMTEGVENGNFVKKLEVFFSSCILEGWKDSIVTLQNTEKVCEWSENLGIVRRCIESIVDKILTPPAKVTWSYTYTRPGHDKKHRRSVPKDWWTEDVSFLGIDMFKCVIITAANTLQPQLIGEALHVYTCRWLLDVERKPHESSTSRAEHSRILDTVVGLIPTEKGSVSVKFLMRLLRIGKFLGASPVTRGELVRLSALQLDEATPDDLVLATQLSDNRNQKTSHDVNLVKAVLHGFLRQWKRRTTSPGESESSLRSIRRVGATIDSYLQVVAKDDDLPVQKVVCLVEALPGFARPQHNDLYKAINIYLKEHPDLNKTDKKQLCGVLDCQKLSPEVRAHAVKNERLPLRTVVQILFPEHEKTTTKTNEPSVTSDDMSKLKISEVEQSNRAKKGYDRFSEPGTSGGGHRSLRKLEGPKHQIREVRGPELENESEIRRLSEMIYNKGRQR